jgi:DNA mismatch repair protein MutS
LALKEYYQLEALDAFGDFSPAQRVVCGALLEYVRLTQCGQMPRLNYPKLSVSNEYLMIDASTRRNLEIHATLGGQRQGSLLAVMDETATAAGARMLGRYLATPSMDPDIINRRLNVVEFFLGHELVREQLIAAMKTIPDIERALSRLAIGKGGPRDLIAIRAGIEGASMIASLLGDKNTDVLAYLNCTIAIDSDIETLFRTLKASLKEEVGVLARDGGYIQDGYHQRLDEVRDLKANGRDNITQLREDYRQKTGVGSLKVTHNNVLGYFVEVTPQHASKLDDEEFIHRQTLANSMRYTTERLRKLEHDIVHAAEEALAIEVGLFDQLVAQVVSSAEQLAVLANRLAVLDVLSGFASLANRCDYARPVVDASLAFDIQQGRHPVVEEFLQKDGGGSFVANDCSLSDKQRLWLLTGPNMAGKSTFLRQNALIAVMAQVGCYVPAKSAHIGVVDKVFSRVGASDDLARGRSTFMVEMVETAAILNQATDRSLVILDEIGRGTATYDGVSIAWAVVESLHNSQACRGLFATHYHELTGLSSDLECLDCYTMKVKEWKGDVVFLHEVVHGAADRSYGIHVAKLAGIPLKVIKRAEAILGVLQNSEVSGNRSTLIDDLPLFANQNTVAVASAVQEESPVESKLQEIDIDACSPREALSILYELKEMCDE